MEIDRTTVIVLLLVGMTATSISNITKYSVETVLRAMFRQRK
jgi:hypothetical protein